MRHPGRQAGRRQISAIPVVGLLVLAAVPGYGCQATTLTAGGAPVPVLIGPVACVGCAAAAAVGPSLAPIEDRSLARTMVGAGPGTTTTAWEKSRPNFARKVAAVVRDPCRIDVHVSRLSASAIGVFALFFAMTSVEVQVDATANLVVNGTCKPNP